MEGHLLMSNKERERKSLFDRVFGGQLTLRAAAAQLGLSYRQTRRSYKRFVAEGDVGLVHRSRGRPGNRSKPLSFRRQVLRRYRQRYAEHPDRSDLTRLFRHRARVDVRNNCEGR